MTWTKTPQDRQRDAEVYGAEYRRNAATCKRRANGRCQKCLKPATRLQADHIVPAAQGGTDALANLQALCQTCHKAKTAREGGGWRKKPRRNPEPTPRTKW